MATNPPPPPRYIPNTPSLQLVKCPDPHKQLLLSLTNIIINYPPPTAKTPPSPDGHHGLFKGPSSVAFLFLRLKDLYPNPPLLIQDKTCKEWCALYLGPATNFSIPEPTNRTEPRGIVDEAFVTLVIRACLTRDETLVRDICSWASVPPTGALEASSNEWMNGRGGVLYLLRVLKHYFPRRNSHSHSHSNNSIPDLLSTTSTTIVTRIMACPRPWKWHNVPFTGLGAVHGITGIMTQVLLSSPSQASQLSPDVESILALQREDGMWGVRIPDNGDDRLVQLCHGPPGVILFLLTVRRYFPDLRGKIDKAVQKGRECIWQRGILTKEPCLCHGVAGNALALSWERFELLMGLVTRERLVGDVNEGVYTLSDGPYSLYCGEAGRAWCWVVAEMGMELQGKCIGWNDL